MRLKYVYRLPLPVCVFLVVACSGITDPVDPLARDAPDVRPYVSGAAAAALGPDGLFPAAEGTSPNGETIISAAQARDLAAAYIKTVGPTLREAWEAQRGAQINLAALTVSRRVEFGQTPYGLFPDEGFHPAISRLYGPFYLVTVQLGAEPVMVMGVSALATDYGVDERSDLIVPSFGGNAFKPFVWPSSTQDFAPLGPEQTVDLAARATRAKIEAIPVLHGPERPLSPSLARWRVELDRDVLVVVPTTGRSATVRTLFVSPTSANRFQIAALDQPREIEATGTKFSATFENLGDFPFVLSIRPASPVRFETVRIVESH
ncbi:MAG: hypothetical protein JWN79_1381 [Gemmatimonadetes bacterium]|jgi:hypothetical protein|nr:hypothetical protein [Gemmatimonadota bacterium]